MADEFDGYDYSSPGGRIAGVEYDEYGRPQAPTFRTPMDFANYIDRLGAGATPGARKQADDIKRNPEQWVMSGGHPRKQDDWAARNMKWIVPAALASVAVGPEAFAFLKGGGGVLPSSHLPTESLMHGPGPIASQAISHTVAPAMAAPGVPNLPGAGTGMIPPPLPARHLPVGDFMDPPHNIGSQDISRQFPDTDFLGPKPDARNTPNGKDGGGVLKWLEPVIAALTGLPGLLANRGPSDEEKAQLEQLRKLQELQQRRIQYQNPLFESVSRLAMSRLPTAVQSDMGEMQ